MTNDILKQFLFSSFGLFIGCAKHDCSAMKLLVTCGFICVYMLTVIFNNNHLYTLDNDILALIKTKKIFTHILKVSF